MNIEIIGMTNILIIDLFLIWLIISLIVVYFVSFIRLFFLYKKDYNKRHLIEKIIKLNADDKSVFKFMKKLNNDDINNLDKFMYENREKLSSNLFHKINRIRFFYRIYRGDSNA